MDNRKMKYKFWNLLLWKRWFDIGNGWTGYFTKVLFVVGIGFAVDSTKNILLIVILGLIYGILNLLIGWAYMKYGLFETDNEISNIYNPFVREMRKSYSAKRQT